MSSLRINLFAAASVALFLGATSTYIQAGPPDTAAIDGAFADAVAAAQKRTVKIYGAGIGRSPAYGTGLTVSAAGEILTANGVHLGGQTLRVTLPDGSTHEATVVRRSQELQSALLKIETETPDYFDLAESTSAEMPAAEAGDWVLAVSNAFKVASGDEPLSVNIGVYGLRMKLDARRGLQDFPYSGDVLLYDAITSNPGAAGGAVVTSEGKLLGMIGRVIEAKSTNTRLNYAVPVDLLAKFVRGEETPMVAVTPTGNTPDLGIRLFALGGRKAPAFVDRIIPGSPAATAGLKSDDLVVTIAGQVVRDAGEFRRIVGGLAIGQEVVVEVKRKNELLSVKLTPVAEK
jgi:serine protease Do